MFLRHIVSTASCLFCLHRLASLWSPAFPSHSWLSSRVLTTLCFSEVDSILLYVDTVPHVPRRVRVRKVKPSEKELTRGWGDFRAGQSEGESAKGARNKAAHLLSTSLLLLRCSTFLITSATPTAARGVSARRARFFLPRPYRWCVCFRVSMFVSLSVCECVCGCSRIFHALAVYQE